MPSTEADKSANVTMSSLGLETCSTAGGVACSVRQVRGACRLLVFLVFLVTCKRNYSFDHSIPTKSSYRTSVAVPPSTQVRYDRIIRCKKFKGTTCTLFLVAYADVWQLKDVRLRNHYMMAATLQESCCCCDL